MAENLLEVRNLVVNVEDKEILHNINLDIKPGETHVLMGPNGAGKSTLGYALMGNPKYTVKGGSINFAGEDITKLAVDKRAKAGLFLSFQNPLEVPGISLSSFLKTALEQQRGVRIKAWDFRKELRQAILDETDSGLDVDAVKIVSQGIKTFQEHRQGALLIITHNTKILDALHVDHTHILAQGQIIKNAGPELVDEVSKNGFEKFLQNKE